MKHILKLTIITFITTGLFSCDAFLDVMPDNRTQLDNPQKIKDLLVTSYPTSNYSLLCEFSSDNILDNWAENPLLTEEAFDRMDTEIYEWKDVASANDSDSPYRFWESYYQSIAAANHVLEAIEELAESGNTTNMNPQKGEALILRAYCHFMLVNVFAMPYRDANLSKNDLGVTYMTKPEKKVVVQYERNSVAEVYELIAKDIEEGFKLIDDGSYFVPKYHFTRAAASAFASQFYLYKRDYAKAIEYANVVLGTGDPSAMLRSWAKTYSNFETEADDYISADEPANLLILPTYSVYGRRFGRVRYGVNGSVLLGTINGAGPTWNNRPPFLSGRVWIRGEQSYGLILARIGEFFEYTDRVAQIGYPHIVRTEFTTDDVLLNRAEAKIMTGDIAGAVTDLQYWNVSHKGERTLTESEVIKFYTAGKSNFVFPFHNQELSPEFVITDNQKPFLDCVLHFRRLERLFEGHRWFDLKRYGIDIKRYIGREKTEVTLTYDDPRRAIQIPKDVEGAGLEPNYRPTNSAGNDIWQLYY
jgi:SusD family.